MKIVEAIKHAIADGRVVTLVEREDGTLQLADSPEVKDAELKYHRLTASMPSHGVVCVNLD